MIDGLNVKDLTTTALPLAELAKQYELLPMSELCKSIDGLCNRLPRTDGEWSGEAGNSKWCPDKNVEPSDSNYSNPDNKTWKDILYE